MGPVGAGAMVAALSKLPKLTYLDLHSNALAAAGAAAIAPHVSGLMNLQVIALLHASAVTGIRTCCTPFRRLVSVRSRTLHIHGAVDWAEIAQKADTSMDI